MYQYLLILNRHANLALKRKDDYRRNIVIYIILCFVFSTFTGISLITFTKEDLEIFAPFSLLTIVICDFSLRFFLTNNAGAAIFPYLTLPIPRKTLIWYIVLSDFKQFWLWGAWLIYGVVLGFCGTLTFGNVVLLLLFILLNNYLTAFVKALISGYAILIFPVCLVFVCLILLICSILPIVFAVMIIACAVIAFGCAEFYTLKENLYKELNRFAL